MVQHIDAARIQHVGLIAMSGFDHDVGAGFLGIRNNFSVPKRAGFGRGVGLFPTRHRYRKIIRESRQQAGFVGQNAMIEQAEQFLFTFNAIDIVEVLSECRLWHHSTETAMRKRGLWTSREFFAFLDQ